jgi:hypothetical protein
MRRTFSQRRRFPIPMRWLYAGGDLTRPKRLDQPTDRSFVRSERSAKTFIACSETGLPVHTHVSSC